MHLISRKCPEREGVPFSSFLLPTGSNVDKRAGAQAAILDDEVNLEMEAMQGERKYSGFQLEVA